MTKIQATEKALTLLVCWETTTDGNIMYGCEDLTLTTSHFKSADAMINNIVSVLMRES